MKKNDSKTEIIIDGRVAIAIIVTFALLVLCAIPMFIGIALDASSGGAPVSSSGGGSISAGNFSQSDAVDTAVGTKTGISLPSATASGSYRYDNDGKTIDISGDTDIKSAAVVLIDITDGRAVAQKNADVKIYPASMTKVMTLLVACENAKDPKALLTVTKEMTEEYAKKENLGASVAFTWQPGDQVTVEDALHMVIYKSDTFACWLLANHIAGNEPAFVKMMNDKAAAMGLTSTNFTNCTGLYNDNHYTTCREMAAIMAAAMNNPTATAIITSTTQYSVDMYAEGQKTDATQKMWCDWYTGRLEAYPWGKAAAYYAGDGSDIKIIAGKTGYETVPKCCFVTAGLDTETQRKYVCVQVGRTDAAQETVSEKTSTDDTRLVYQKYAKENE